VKKKDGIAADIAKEIGHWIFFSLVVGLAQLWIIPILYYLFQKNLTWVELIGNGSLLFFTTTITAKTAGEYFKKVQGSAITNVACFGAAMVIILASVSCYTAVTATRAGLVPGASLSPARVAIMSNVLATVAIVFSLAYTSIIRAFGK
jgi:hypothetical protein